jgi:hypothetical protein
MVVDRRVMGLAGAMVLGGSVLAAKVSAVWLWLTGAVGAMLIVAAVTGVCLLSKAIECCGGKTSCGSGSCQG